MPPVIEAPAVRPTDPAPGPDAGKMPAVPPARTPALQAGPARPASSQQPEAKGPQPTVPSNPQSEFPNPESVPSNPQSVPPNPQSVPPNPQSAIPNPQSVPSNPQSSIRNPQSLWLSLTGLLPGLVLAPDRRRAGLQALAQWVLDRLQTHVQAATAALARELTFPLPFPPQPGSPFYEPSFALAAELGLPESKLNQFLREVSGLTARETWDYLRVSQPLWDRLRRDIRLLLGSQPFVPAGRDGTGPEHFLKMLRAARRERGWTAQVRAWRLGYRNAARLNQAVWAATGRSLSEMEAEVLYEECIEWQRVRAGAPSPHAGEGRNEHSEAGVRGAPSPLAGEGRDERSESGVRGAPSPLAGEGRNERSESGVRGSAPAQHHVQHFSDSVVPPKPQSEVRHPQSPVVPIRRTAAHVGPNGRCPCGSGKKHKKCCGRLARVA